MALQARTRVSIVFPSFYTVSLVQLMSVHCIYRYVRTYSHSCFIYFTILKYLYICLMVYDVYIYDSQFKVSCMIVGTNLLKLSVNLSTVEVESKLQLVRNCSQGRGTSSER